MKESVIQKINQFGKVGQIIVNISMVIFGVATIGCIIAAIVFFVLPKSLLRVDYDNRMTATMDFSSFEASLSEEEIAQLKSSVYKGNSGITLNDNSYKVEDVIYDENSVSLVGKSGQMGFSIRNMALAMLVGTVFMATTWLTFFFIASLCKELKTCETPFAEGIIKKLNQVAISLIPLSIVTSLGSSFIRSIFAGGSMISLNLNLGSVIMVILILGLVQIFRYGAMLQRESDETL